MIKTSAILFSQLLHVFPRSRFDTLARADSLREICTGLACSWANRHIWGCPCALRRVVVWDEEKQREIVLLTNHPDFWATTIAAIYKDRWEIALFFKALKQNLKVKAFVGTSENALRIQIWTALLALLLLKWLHHLSRASWSFSTLAAMLRMNLFTHRVLADWPHNPQGIPPPEPGAQNIEQLLLPLAALGQRSTA